MVIAIGSSEILPKEKETDRNQLVEVLGQMQAAHAAGAINMDFQSQSNVPVIVYRYNATM